MRVRDVEKAIGIPSEKWKGNCYAIASAIVEAGLIEGDAVYGLYLGDVDDGSPLAYRGAVQRHGWVLCKDGTILDPTRWVFENAKPYIYHGPQTGEYDEGAQSLRMMMGRNRPFPEYDPEKAVVFDAPKPALDHLEEIVGETIDAWSMDRIHWVATLPYQLLKPHVADIYAAVLKTAAWAKALIPIDHQTMCDREYGTEWRK